MMERKGEKLQAELTVNRPLKHGPFYAMLRTGTLTVTLPLSKRTRPHRAQAIAKREIVARLFEALDQLTMYHDPHGT